MKLPISVKFGIYVSIASFISYLIAYFLGIHNSPRGVYVELIPFLFLIIGVILSMRQTKIKEKAGQIDYRNAVKAGVITASMVAIVLAALVYCYYSFINTNFVDYMVAEAQKYWQTHGQTEEFIKTNVQTLRDVSTPAKEAYKTFMGMLVMGMFSSLVIAFFIRNIADEARARK